MKITELTPKDFQHLSSERRSIYKKLIPKELWSCLEGNDPWGVSNAEIYATVADTKNGVSKGIALATYRRQISWATLLSLPSSSSHDTEALSLPLLIHLEENLRKEKCHTFSHVYSTASLEAPQLELLFQQAGWCAPQLFIVRYHFEGATFSPTWFEHYRQALFPEDFELFCWGNLDSTELESLLVKQNQKRFPVSISPFHEENTIEPINSLGVRYKDSVIGWVITNRVDQDTIRYSSFYMDPDHRSSVVSIYLLAASIDLQLKAKVAKGIVEVNLSQVDHKWIAFAKKRLAPSAVFIERLYEVVHYLQNKSNEIDDFGDDEIF